MNLWLLLALLVILYAVFRIKIASEHERFTVHRLGKFVGFKGPGLLIKWSGTEDKWTRIIAGDRGELTDQAVAKVNGVHIPVELEGTGSTGQFVRIKGFLPGTAKVILDSNQARTIICEKCGHENMIR